MLCLLLDVMRGYTTLARTMKMLPLGRCDGMECTLYLFAWSDVRVDFALCPSAFEMAKLVINFDIERPLSPFSSFGQCPGFRSMSCLRRLSNGIEQMQSISWHCRKVSGRGCVQESLTS